MASPIYSAAVPSHTFEGIYNTYRVMAAFCANLNGTADALIRLVQLRVWIDRLISHSDASVRCVLGPGTSTIASFRLSTQAPASSKMDPPGYFSPLRGVIFQDVNGGGAAQRVLSRPFRLRRGLVHRWARNEGPVVTLQTVAGVQTKYLALQVAFDFTPAGVFVVEADMGADLIYEDLKR